LLAVSLSKRQLTRALNGTKTVGFVRASQIIANNFCPLKLGVSFIWIYVGGYLKMSDNSIVFMMLNFLGEVIINPITLPTITFLLGLLGGHHFALSRDKRKEFNEVAKELGSKFYTYFETDNSYYLPSTKELDLFASYVAFYKRNNYAKRVLQLSDSLRRDSESWTENPSTGEATQNSAYTSKTKEHALKVSSYFKRI